jgi:hypothetical protein
MPWQETLLMDQRVQFIADYQRGFFDLADLARRYGISRKTAYKWVPSATYWTARVWSRRSDVPRRQRIRADR